MTYSKDLFDYLIKNITVPEPPEEVEAIAFGLLQHLGISKTDVIANKLSDVAVTKLQPFVQRLNNSEPLQYILNEAWFYRRKYFVDKRVLIPRPETELLVQEVLKRIRPNDKILDIGTGSGCIAISIILEFLNVEVAAIDVSPDALQVAKRNAAYLGARVQFFEEDILKPGPALNKRWSIIVSNPPYIGMDESATIKKNVIAFEPHIALFSPGNPLLFYEAIANYGRNHLEKEGWLAVEINERYGSAVLQIFKSGGYKNLTLGRDLSDKPRIIFGQPG